MKKTESKKLPKAGSDTPIAEISDTVSTESKKKTPSKSSAKSVRKTKKADTGIIKAPVKAIPVRVKIETFAAATPPKEERTSVNSKAEVSEEEKKSPAAGKKVLRKKGTGDSLRLAERISTSSEVAAHIAAAKGHMLRKVKLSKAKKTYYRDLLLAKRREFQQQLNIHRDDALISKKDTSGSRIGMANHMADLGSDNFQHDFTLGLLSGEGQVLDMIEEALVRLEESEFGVCLECGSEIPPERLELKPYARYCVSCKTKKESMESPEHRHR